MHGRYQTNQKNITRELWESLWEMEYRGISWNVIELSVSRCNPDLVAESTISTISRCNLELVVESMISRSNLDLVAESTISRCNLDLIVESIISRCNLDLVVESTISRCNPEQEYLVSGSGPSWAMTASTVDTRASRTPRSAPPIHTYQGHGG